MIRLFVAIPIPEDIRMDLASICHGLPGVRWVPEENYHITLRFLGGIENGLADDLDAALSMISAPPVHIDLTGLGYFAKKDKAHTLFAKCHKNDGLVHLQKKVESAVVRSGLDPEPRKFAPHITLARMKGEAPGKIEQYCGKTRLPDDMSFTADRFTLFSSHLNSQGSIYTAEVDYPLQGCMAESVYA